MICPSCGLRMRQTVTRHRVKLGVTRHYYCLACNVREQTVEVTVLQIRRLEKAAELIEIIKKN